jgi:hypothetical protein
VARLGAEHSDRGASYTAKAIWAEGELKIWRKFFATDLRG